MTTIAIASGKGGVGKSTIALNLALALSEQGRRVGLLDADLYGPDIPRMIGLARTRSARYLDLWSARPEKTEALDAFGIKFMSAGFLVAENQSLSLESVLVDALLVWLTRGIDWGVLDDLVIDLPPGTADLQQQLMKRVPLDGVLLVVTPQDVAHLDAKKVLDLCRRTGVRVFGGVENMWGLRCPTCDERIDVFPRVARERSIWTAGVPRLAEIPLDPEVAQAGDDGRPLLLSHPSSPQSEAIRALAQRLATVES
jgi:ATP-binding protein involved in chromosome partitioning